MPIPILLCSAGQFRVNFGDLKTSCLHQPMRYKSLFLCMAFYLSLYSIFVMSLRLLVLISCSFSILGLFNKTSSSPIFFLLYYLNFLSKYGQPYPAFRFHLDILLFDVPVALILMVGMSHLCIVYHNCM